MSDLVLELIKFLGDNLKIVFYLNGIWLGIVIVTYLFINRSQIRTKRVFNRSLFLLVICGELLLIFLYGFIHWEDTRKGICAAILPDTFWVNSKFPIYFITGKDLVTINLDGTGFKYLLEPPDPVREYHFSPDGKFILAVTDQELYKIDKMNQRWELVDSLSPLARERKTQGYISQIKWAPDSQKFCYALYQWSPVSSQDTFYVFDMLIGQKSAVKNPFHKISEIYWDTDSKNLYYYTHELKSLKDPKAYEIRIFQIPLQTLTSHLISTFPASSYLIESFPLGSHGISLYLPKRDLTFKRLKQKRSMAISEKGWKAIFESNYSLYYEKKKGSRIKLYRFTKDKKRREVPVQDIVWIPGGQIFILIHETSGALVVKPSAAKMGKLIDIPMDAMGLYWQGKI